MDTPREAPLRTGQGLFAEAISVFPGLTGDTAAGQEHSDVFSMAVHELRTPLTAIDGQTQLAQRYLERDPARAAAALVSVREQVARLARLIGDLLDARIGARGLHLEVVTFDLGVAVASTVALVQPSGAPRIAFTDPGAVRVRGDPDRIAQILTNLLDNALRYSRAGSPVEVTLTADATEALIRVNDRGVGVPEAERGLLFSPFYRTSRTRDVAGTGLGLHISRRIAAQHRGRVGLESSSDAGSTFVLALPLVGA